LILTGAAALVATFRNPSRKQLENARDDVKQDIKGVKADVNIDIDATADAASNAAEVKRKLEETAHEVKSKLDHEAKHVRETLGAHNQQMDTAIDALKQQTESIHILVNSKSLERLRALAEATARLAESTHLPADIAAAEMFAAEYAQDVEKQKAFSGRDQIATELLTQELQERLSQQQREDHANTGSRKQSGIRPDTQGSSALGRP
jgi:hypothetical protein